MNSLGADVTITLTRQEFESLLLVVGFAGGYALRDQNTSIFRLSVRCANAVNRDNPGYMPYDVPEAPFE